MSESEFPASSAADSGSVTSGYFGPSHKNTLLAQDKRHLTAYIARFKHALLFNYKLILADHMIVNAPNFRIAYHTDSTFRDIINPSFVELAHFDQHKDGVHMTLSELRSFYRTGLARGSPYSAPLKAMKLFHPQLPNIFRTEEFDAELNAIQAGVVRRFPASAERDPCFTKRSREALDNDVFKDLFAAQGMYGAYQTAYDLMVDDQDPGRPLGIIHFDPEHRFSREPDVFHYMARICGVSRPELVKRFGRPIARAHRTMLLGVETELLGSHAILPVDLIGYGPLVLKTADERVIDKKDREVKRISLDLSTIHVPALASLTVKEMLMLRTSDQGQEYFQITRLRAASSDTLVRSVSNYCRHIRFMLGKKMLTAPKDRGFRSSIRLLRGAVLSDSGKRIGVATFVTVSGAAVNHYYHEFNPTGAIKTLVETAASKFPAGTPRDGYPGDAINSRLEKYPSLERLTQYE